MNRRDAEKNQQEQPQIPQIPRIWNLRNPWLLLLLQAAGLTLRRDWPIVLRMARPIVTLTTDFGLSDYFVGTMKGVILATNPEADIVDISHDVRSHDILDGAFTIAQAYSYFPNNTLHVVVVDPGVGSQRRPILVRTDRHVFLCPDNGVLSLVMAREEHQVIHITSDHYFLSPVSNTFHGRDVFAPVAGWLTRGVELPKFGDPITDYVRFAPPRPKVLNEKALKGVVLKVDKFGNAITNITAQDVPLLLQQNPPPFKITAGKGEISKLNAVYAQSAPGEVFAILGSTGYLELAANRGAAARILAVDRGSEVGVVFG
jgi:S-adenosylmethionine hydrolase